MKNKPISNHGLQLFVASVGAVGVLLLSGIIASNTGLASLGLVLVMTAIIGQVAVSLGADEANLFGQVPEKMNRPEASTATLKKVS